MPRPISEKVSKISKTLIDRLKAGYYQPGDSFMSNRALAKHFGVTYQTAHRIITQLVEMGWLVRKSGSGTFIQGDGSSLTEVLLCFNERAKSKGSFGAHLLSILKTELIKQKVSFRVSYKTDRIIPPNAYPVLWEVPDLLHSLYELQRYALLLHNKPEPGISASYIDSIAVNNHSGGAAAGEILKRTFKAKQPIIFAGPKSDWRSHERISGFLMHYSACEIVYANSWHQHNNEVPLDLLFKNKSDGIFCANDRLAQAALTYAKQQSLQCPPIIGFDNAPIAEKLNINTIAIPYDELTRIAVEIIKSRIKGDKRPSTHHSVMPRPVFRTKSEVL